MVKKSKTASVKRALNSGIPAKLCVMGAMAFFSVFILLVFTDYTNITAVKYNIFIIGTISLTAIYFFEKCADIFEGRVNFKTHKSNYLPYILVISFLLFNCISALFSPFRGLLNSKGQSVLIFGDARYDGLLVTSLYIILFLIFSFEKSFGTYFTRIVTATLGLTALTGILQLFGINVFNFYPNGNFYVYPKFISTLGNVDMVSALYCILLPLVTLSYVCENLNGYFKFFQLIICFFSIFLFWKIKVDSGIVAVVTTLLLILNLLFLKKKLLLRFTNVLIVSILGVILSNIIVLDFDSKAEKLLLDFQIDNSLLFFGFTLIAITGMTLIYKYLLPENKLKICFLWFIAFEIISVAVVLFLILRFAKAEHGTIYEFSEILKGRGKNGYGSARFGLWKYTLQLSNERFLIGHGAGTFRTGLVEFTSGFSKRYSRGNFDFAHNEFLQIYYNSGILGLFSYLGLIGTFLVTGFKKSFNNGKVLMLSMAFICYLIQSFFMFSIVIVSPLFWIIAGMLCYEIRSAQF